MRPVEEILCPDPRGVLSLVGAGGKTSLMFHLASQLSRSGKRVLTTTTTKLFFPTADQSQTVLIAADPEAILLQASSCQPGARHITAAAAHSVDTGKLQGFPQEAIRVFRDSGLFDWILVEADGAARRPLKAPAEHEPVIPLDSTVIVAVAGLEVVGAPLSEELVFRCGLAGTLMGLAAGETITESSLARLIAHPFGSFKGAPPDARRFLFLNKADSPARRECGARVAACLNEMPVAVAEAVIVGQALSGVCGNAVYPLLVRT